MTDTVWIDATHGAAGDMLLAALLDAGARLDQVNQALARLPVEPVQVRVEPVRRHGMRACRAHVEVAASQVERTLPDVVRIVTDGGLPAAAERFALAVFTRLAEAESTVHGVAQAHFHEVGALDSIADVVGCAVALHDLGILDDRTRVVVSPIAVGSGTVRTAHGLLSVPAPATLHLLTGVPVAAHPAAQELCTPTGAALLITLADAWGPLPACTPTRVGVGAGTQDPTTHPNTVRLVLAEAGAEPPGHTDAALVLVEATVDDLDPRLWPQVLDSVRAAGALDTWHSPLITRDGRPGVCLSVLAEPGALDAISRTVFLHTTTLGVRIHRIERRSLHRDQVPVYVGGHTVMVKRGWLDGAVVTLQPEYADARTAADDLHVPVRNVLDTARAAARSPSPSGDAGSGPANRTQGG